MEELKRRCEFDNTTVKVQACQKLLELCTSKLTKAEPLTSKSKESTELQLLWEKCAAEDLVVARTCCNAVFSLVQNGLADFEYILQGLLNLVPTAKCLSGICAGVFDLLVLHQVMSVEHSGKYSCPYTIRDPPHPLVTIVTNRPDSWFLLVQNIERIYTLPDIKSFEYVYEMLKPLIQFTLCEPQQSPQYLPLRSCLIPTLLHVARRLPPCDRNRLKGRIVNLLAHSQLKSAQNLSELSHHVTSILQSYLNDKEVTSDPEKQTTRTLVVLSLDVCRVSLDYGMDTSLTMGLVTSMAEAIPECLGSSEAFLLLVHLLQKLTPPDVNIVLKLVHFWLRNNQGRDPILEGMALLPTLQCLSGPILTKSSANLHQLLARKVLKILRDGKSRMKSEDKGREIQSTLHLSPDGAAIRAYVLLAESLGDSDEVVADWLGNMQSCMNHHSNIPYVFLCLLASILSHISRPADIRKVLNATIKIAEQDQSKSPCLLPLLLYQMKRHSEPEIKLMILEAIPLTVTHKVAVSPVLRTLQILNGNQRVKAVAVTLFSSLWQKEDRCFPYLQQLILDSTPGGQTIRGKNMEEHTLARATAIRDVCKFRPHQHGGDVLAPLSEVLSHCTSEASTTAAALVLEGLYYLCESEMIDILTAWSELSPKLTKEERTLVINNICRLLSLVPELETEGKEYEAFMDETLMLLWSFAQSENHSVCGAAFRALAKFSFKQFNLKHLPNEVTADIQEGAVKAAMADGKDPSQVAPPDLPGFCYMRLLRQLPEAVLPDYETFLTAMVREEVSGIPRGIHHTINRKKTTSTNQSKAIAAIPSFLNTEFERNQVPGLRPSLAVGVLHSYDPPVTTGRDGKPRTHQVIQLGRNFHQMLYTLLQETPVQTGDWHQCMSLPQAWARFMDRCLDTCAEGRRLELVQQLEKGQAMDPDENLTNQNTAYFWARDKITDLITSASSGNPSVQANSLCALGGLVLAVTRFYGGLDEEGRHLLEGTSEHLNYSHWLSVVIDTLMCILDNKFVTNGKVLNLCHLRGGQERSSCSVLAQCGAGLGLSMIVPVIVSSNMDAIYHLLEVLTSRLPDTSLSGDSRPVLDFFHPLSLGMVLARLFEEHFVETGGTQGMVAVWKSLNALEKVCFSEEGPRLGAYLGLSMCLAAMCSDNKTDSRVHVTKTHERLSEAVDSLPVTDAAFEGVSICLSALSGISYLTNILTQTAVDQSVTKLYQLHCDNPQIPGIALALGMICHLLIQANHPTVGDLTMKLSGSWISGLDQDLPTLQRLTFLKGLMAVCGSEKLTYNATEDAVSASPGISISEVAKATQQLVRACPDLGLQSACGWQLGQLCMTAGAGGSSRLCVPMTYHYLSETSVIRAAVDLILEAGKHDTIQVREELLVSTLRALTKGPLQALPPLNWAGVLSPIIRMTYGAPVERWSLELAASQSLVSPSAGLLLSSWLVSPLWTTLKRDSRLAMYRNLPKLIKSVPLTKLKEFFDTGFMEPFQELSSSGQPPGGGTVEECQACLEGLLWALQAPDPPRMVAMLLFQTVETVHHCMPKVLHVALQKTLCRCLSHLPDDLVDKVIAKDFDDLDLYERSLFVRCYLVSNGNQPLAWVNSAVEAFMCKTESNSEVCLRYLLHCFHSVYLNKADYCDATKCHVWTLELMGHIKNIATNVIPVKGLDKAEVLEFLLLVFSAAVCSWSGGALQLLVAPVPLTQLGKGDKISIGGAGTPSVKPILKAGLAQSLEEILHKEPWAGSTGKVIQWLMTLCESEPIQNSSLDFQNWIKDCLNGLRHTRDFQKIAVWSKVLSISQ